DIQCLRLLPQGFLFVQGELSEVWTLLVWGMVFPSRACGRSQPGTLTDWAGASRLPTMQSRNRGITVQGGDYG
ncbi:MAG TPA: hypothetical protein VFA32_23705, partial [Dehalococcoidia bacterium]|nr:hypothetical protein [Dehalococcoidia bacterium]